MRYSIPPLRDLPRQRGRLASGYLLGCRALQCMACLVRNAQAWPPKDANAQHDRRAREHRQSGTNARWARTEASLGARKYMVPITRK